MCLSPSLCRALPLPPPLPASDGGCCAEYRQPQPLSWLEKLKQCRVEGLGDCQVPYIFLLPRSEKSREVSSPWPARVPLGMGHTCGCGKSSQKGYWHKLALLSG